MHRNSETAQAPSSTSHCAWPGGILTPYDFAQILGRSLHHTGISDKMHKILHRYLHWWDSLVREVPATWLLCELLFCLRHSYFNAQIIHSPCRFLTCRKVHKMVTIWKNYSCAFHEDLKLIWQKLLHAGPFHTTCKHSRLSAQSHLMSVGWQGSQ